MRKSIFHQEIVQLPADQMEWNILLNKLQELGTYRYQKSSEPPADDVDLAMDALRDENGLDSNDDLFGPDDRTTTDIGGAIADDAVYGVLTSEALNLVLLQDRQRFKHTKAFKVMKDCRRESHIKSFETEKGISNTLSTVAESPQSS